MHLRLEECDMVNVSGFSTRRTWTSSNVAVLSASRMEPAVRNDDVQVRFKVFEHSGEANALGFRGCFFIFIIPGCVSLPSKCNYDSPRSKKNSNDLNLQESLEPPVMCEDFLPILEIVLQKSWSKI